MAGPAKSGFAAGRSSNGTARSSMSSARKPAQPKPNKAERMAAKVRAAQEELRDLIGTVETNPWDEPGDRPTGTLIGTGRGKSTAVAVRMEDDEEGAGGLDELQAKINAKFYGLRDYIGVENDSYNAEAANRILLRSILSTVIELLPEAVHVYRKTHKEQAGYVVAAFMTQARDVNSELRMASDADNQAEFIRNRIVVPVFTGFANMLLAEGMALRDEINKQLKTHPKGTAITARLERMMTNLAAFMDQSNGMMSANITAYLNGDTSFLQTETGGGVKKRRGGGRGGK